MQIKLINTADGSATLFLKELNDHYHSVNGAITESNYVFIDKGYLFHGSKSPAILEIGFGTGLNCFLTAIQAERLKRPTLFYTIEKFPLEKQIISQLNYPDFFPENGNELFEIIHSCAWNEKIRISEYFTLYKLDTDLLTSGLKEVKSCDICYFDAFGPDKQPEMWQPEILMKVGRLLSPGGVFVTYSAKGEVRRHLSGVGLRMERLPGPPGKKQMLRGIKSESAD